MHSPSPIKLQVGGRYRLKSGAIATIDGPADPAGFQGHTDSDPWVFWDYDGKAHGCRDELSIEAEAV